MIAGAADMAERADRLAAVGQQRLLERRIAPGVCDNQRAIVWPDPGLVSLDDGVERRRVDVALLGQDGLQRANPKFGLGQFGMGMRMIVGMVVVTAHPARIIATNTACRG